MTTMMMVILMMEMMRLRRDLLWLPGRHGYLENPKDMAFDGGPGLEDDRFVDDLGLRRIWAGVTGLERLGWSWHGGVGTIWA